MFHFVGAYREAERYIEMSTKPLPREATLIVNCMSRTGDDVFEQVKQGLIDGGLTLRETYAIKDPEEMDETVRMAVNSGVPMVIIGGGDGSLSASVDDFVGTDCVFAILPLGTANSSARTLGIPLDIEGAVKVITHGIARRIDLGMIDDDYFVNAASLGISPMIGETVPHGLKRWLGRAGYLLWAMKCALTFRPFRLELSDGDNSWSLWSTEIRILNGPYHGGIELSDTAEVDSGEIVIQAVVGSSKWKLGWDWFAKTFKLKKHDSETREFRGKSFRLVTKPALRVSIDGEVYKNTPIRVGIAGKAVHVAVPS